MFHSGTGGLGIVNRGIDMTNTKKLIAPALIGLAIFAYAPAYADGPGKNGDGTEVIVPPTNTGGNGGDDKNGGGTGGDGKNGGDTGGDTGGDGKNGGGTDNNGGGSQNGGAQGQPAAHGDGNPGGGGGDDKNGGNPPPPPPKPPGGGGDGKNGGGIRVVIGDRGSRGDVVDYHQITCVVNGHVFQARSTRECYRGSRSFDGGIGGGGGYGIGGGYAYKFRGHGGYGDGYAQGGGVQVYRPRVRRPRVVVSGGFEGDYGYAPQPRVRYYRPASPAAVMQAERRRQRAEFSYGGGYDVQGGYGAGYAYGGGYGYEGQMGYGEGGGYVRQRKHARKVRHARRHGAGYGNGRQMQGGYAYDGGIGFSYDPGVVLHYGPTLTKDGGY
jgi:hypothetical protein